MIPGKYFQEWNNPGPRLAKHEVTKARRHKGNRIFAIGGGVKATPFKAVEEYDPATDTWRKRPDMPFAIGAHFASVVDGKIYTENSPSFGRSFINP